MKSKKKTKVCLCWVTWWIDLVFSVIEACKVKKESFLVNKIRENYLKASKIKIKDALQNYNLELKSFQEKNREQMKVLLELGEWYLTFPSDSALWCWYLFVKSWTGTIRWSNWGNDWFSRINRFCGERMWPVQLMIKAH